MLGSTPWEKANVASWITWAENAQPLSKAVADVIFGQSKDYAGFKTKYASLKSEVNVLNEYLQGRQWLVGDSVTLADIYCGYVLFTAFQLALDETYQKASPYVTAWFKRVVGL